MSISPTRKALFERVARSLTAMGDGRLIVAVDGVDGAGKTMFADELSEASVALGLPVVRASVDGFHNPRSIRYRRGRDDPQGFFLDSYDYDKLCALLLAPFRRGDASVRVACFDHRTDSQIVSDAADLSDRTMLLIDGIFLHRDELAGWWDASIFLDVAFEVSYQRMATRDCSDPKPDAPANHRYLEGQKLYLRRCDPISKASIVIDNTDLNETRIVRADIPELAGPRTLIRS